MDQSTDQSEPIQSILVVDCGTLHTRAVLLDVVEEEYRFVGGATAPTTTEPPFPDITIGVYNAIAELEATTGRRLVEDGHIVTPQHTDGHGVDVFLATCSAAPALRLVIAGLTRGYSIHTAQLAVDRTYTHLLDVISVDDPPPATAAAGAREGAWRTMQVDKLLALSPDAVVLVGGVEGGPLGGLLRLADVLVRTVSEVRDREERAALIGGTVSPPPLVVYAGNSSAVPRLQAALGDNAELITVANAQPALDEARPADLRTTLLDLYRHHMLPSLPGFQALDNAGKAPIQPTAEAIELVTHYVSAQYRREVLTADVGAATTTLIRAGGGEVGESRMVVRGDYGLATGLANLLADVGPEAVLRWLPFPYTAEELSNWALNKVLRPLGLPQTSRDLAIEHAFAREALRAMLARLKAQPGGATDTYDLLIGTGGLLANVPRVGQAALLLLDALEPTGEGVGSFELALDSTLLLSAIGALAPVAPGAAAYVFDRDCLLWLGTAIVPLGAPSPGAARRNGRKADTAPALTAAGEPLAVEVTVAYAGGAGNLKSEVPYGGIEVIPLRPEQRASLTVRPGPGFRIGTGEPGKMVQTGEGEEVKGGLIGLIVDARGRPLTLPTDEGARIERLVTWGRALRAIGTRETFIAGPSVETMPEAPPAPGLLGFSGGMRPTGTPAAFPLPGEVEPEAGDEVPPAPGLVEELYTPVLPNSPFAARRRGTAPLQLPGEAPPPEDEPEEEP
jgi:hypothetical protein